MSSNNAEIKKATTKNDEGVLKSENNIVKPEQINDEIINFESEPQSKETKDKVVLGELLTWLRENKLMSILMICRQIDSVRINGDIVELGSEQVDLKELIQNERNKLELDKFFRAKNLSYRIKEQIKEYNPIDSLKELFGEKLIVR